jgi:hypothetical protein
MSLLRVSLRLLSLLALAAACTGKRADPEPSQNPPPISNEGGGTNGGAPSNGGNGAGPSTGGNGGTPSTGGMGGMPGTGGTGGAPTAGAPGTGGGNATLNDPSDVYPFCGCIADAMAPGACDNCITTAAVACPLPPDCVDDCPGMVTALRSCSFGDLACIQTVFDTSPEQFDDAVAVIECECSACADPVCDSTACGG